MGRTDAGVGDVAPGEHGRARGAAHGLDIVVAAAPARTALSAHGLQRLHVGRGVGRAAVGEEGALT